MIESKNGIIGVAVGDAMGLPVQFEERTYVKANPVTKMLGHMCFNMPKGSWSDDTSMTLATIDAIVKDGEINSKTIMDNFVKWLKDNEYTPTGKAYDIGRTCMTAICNYAKGGVDPDEAGLKEETDNGNGSLMRIAPVIYYCYAQGMDNDEIYETVKQVSSLTHAHEVSVLGCYIYVLFGICLLLGDDLQTAYKKVKKEKYDVYFSEESIEKYNRILEGNINEEEEDDINSSGYVLHTLEATFWCLLNTKSYNEAILKAVNLGGDTDSIAACTGGLAGIYYGLESINEEWRKDLLRYDYIEELCEEFDKVLYLFFLK